MKSGLSIGSCEKRNSPVLIGLERDAVLVSLPFRLIQGQCPLKSSIWPKFGLGSGGDNDTGEKTFDNLYSSFEMRRGATKPAKVKPNKASMPAYLFNLLSQTDHHLGYSPEVKHEIYLAGELPISSDLQKAEFSLWPVLSESPECQSPEKTGATCLGPLRPPTPTTHQRSSATKTEQTFSTGPTQKPRCGFVSEGCPVTSSSYGLQRISCHQGFLILFCVWDFSGSVAKPRDCWSECFKVHKLP